MMPWGVIEVGGLEGATTGANMLFMMRSLRNRRVTCRVSTYSEPNVVIRT